MKVSYNWIRDFIKIPESIDTHTDLLTSLGLEVEGIEPFESVKGSLEGIVVGHVLSCEQHPNADKLKLTKVDLGTGEPVQIVCGAPNVAAGQKVPVATIGTTLYDEQGEPWKIKKGKIRGEESHGMICAEDELGIGTSHDGIMVLEENLTPGTPFNEVVTVVKDQVIEIGLTPNRADAMSHLGVARDLRAGLALDGDLLEFITPSVSSFHVNQRSHRVDIDVQRSDLAPRYCGITLKGLTIKESPDWIKNRLKAIGIAPKNNVVDITNYVMHELGQPLHAFDLATVTGLKIEVKTLEAGTKFTTLDGEERELHEDDLMICDAEKPLCIAGVYGGLNSGVTDNTSAIFLESAYFNPVSIRKTAKRHGLNTDASFRFERGINPNITDYALKRAAILILETAGGEINMDLADVYSQKIEDLQVFLPYEKVTKLVGQEIPKEDIKSILRTLDINVNSVTEGGIGLTIPAYRNDVTRPADVIEEILRVYGYDRIETSNKLNASIAKTSRLDNHKIQNRVADQLAGQGFVEIMANSLTAEKHHLLTEQITPNNEVRMLNPLSSDLSVMRQSLIYGGLEAIAHNINRKQENLRFFEFGNSYHQYQERQFTESKHLTLFATGQLSSTHWSGNVAQADFFYLKGVVKAIFHRLGILALNEKPTQMDFLSEGISLNSGKKLADLGVVKGKVAKHFNINHTVHFANIYWDQVLELLKEDRRKVTDIPKFPAVKRDLALLIDQSVNFKDLHDIAVQTERKLLKEVQLFDVYEGKNLPEGKKSYALSFTLQDQHKTLTDKQIDKVMQKLQQQFEKQLGAQLR